MVSTRRSIGLIRRVAQVTLVASGRRQHQAQMATMRRAAAANVARLRWGRC
jgi:hypothetical protein